MVDKENKEYDFSGFIEDELDERIATFLGSIMESTQKMEDHDRAIGIEGPYVITMLALKRITETLSAGGYINRNGSFTPLSPSDLSYLQKSIVEGVKLRSDLLMLPLGPKEALSIQEQALKVKLLRSGKKSLQESKHTNTGLQQPPMLSPIDSTTNEQSSHTPLNKIALPEKTS